MREERQTLTSPEANSCDGGRDTAPEGEPAVLVYDLRSGRCRSEGSEEAMNAAKGLWQQALGA